LFQQFVAKFSERIRRRFVTDGEWFRVAEFFWLKMCDSFHERWKMIAMGEDAFVSFVDDIKYSFIHKIDDAISDLFTDLSLQGRNYFMNFEDNCIEDVVLKNF